LFFSISGSFIYSQSLEETLAKITGDASKSYLSPIISAFGANTNTGWIRRSPQAKIFGIDIELSVVGMATFFENDNKTFSSRGSFRFDSSQASIIASGVSPAFRNSVIDSIRSRDFQVEISGPTIVGSNKDSIRVIFPGAVIGGQSLANKTIVLPVTGYLEDIPALPLFAPQVTLGTVYGTQVALRYLPTVKIGEDLGEFKYFGFGIQHNPAMWASFELPVNVSVGYFTQSMEVGKVFKTSASIFGLYASKKFGFALLSVEPYAGISFESSSVETSYDVIYDTPTGDQTATISYKLDGENSSRFTIGTNLKLLFLNLNVDYNLAKYNSIGLGLNFRF
jgi:hypothetical protein